jgi:hypothetical protein
MRFANVLLDSDGLHDIADTGGTKQNVHGVLHSLTPKLTGAPQFNNVHFIHGASAQTHVRPHLLPPQRGMASGTNGRAPIVDIAIGR